MSGNTSGDRHIVQSPNGDIEISFELKPGLILCFPSENCPFYSIRYKGREVIGESQLGLRLSAAPELSNCFEIENVRTSEHEGEWRPPYGERDVIPDCYREMVVELRETIPPHRRLHITFRAYNEGAAFAYTIPEQDGLDEFCIIEELSHFTFPEGAVGVGEYYIEGEYEQVPVAEIKPNCEWPLTVQLADGTCVCITEAALRESARMQFVPEKWCKDGKPRLASTLNGDTFARPPFTTAWRAFIIGDRPGDLIERDHLVANLNPPSVIDDTSWIKPGKVIREVTLSTPGCIACVDFAVEHGLDYVELDSGWYGIADRDATDARTVDVASVMKNPEHPGLDLPHVIEYARSKGIGIWLYVNRQALERQIDELFPLYASWGIAGVKAGFVNVGQQGWARWNRDLVRKAAEHKLMIDIHDEYRPTGLCRTYPNLLTQEGVRGQEHMPTARHNCTLPFARFPAGPADYTPSYLFPRIKNRCSHQLALPVIYYSPLQFLYWYMRPAQLRDLPEMAFWAHVPTVWDETLCINGEIGECVTMARRSGRDWFVGSITSDDERTLDISLAFLEPGVTYAAEIYSDSGSATERDDSRTSVVCEERTVDAGTVIAAHMPALGGHAMRLVPGRSK